MADCVYREAVLALAKDIVVLTKDGEYRHRCIDPDKVRGLPPVQPDRKKGVWAKKVRKTYGYKVIFAQCSVCGRGVEVIGYNYCPNCGAEMVGET